MAVVEHLMLLRPCHTPEHLEEYEEILDLLWSLQYRIPQVLCATAGQVDDMVDSRVNVHFLHFRHTNMQAYENCRQHPLFVSTIERVSQASREPVLDLAFQANVPKTMETIFRRGKDFEGDGSVEHVLLLGSSGGASPDAGLTFLDKLCQLAESSLGGAVQCTYGSVVPTGTCKSKFAFLGRFYSPEHLSAFMRTPAYKALSTNDNRLPVCLDGAYSFTSIASSSAGAQRAQ